MDALIDAQTARMGALDWLASHAADAPELKSAAWALARVADDAAETCHWGLR